MKKVYTHLEEIILCVLLTVLVCVSGIQVAARYLFNNSLTWSEELCRYIYVWSGFLTIPFVIKKGNIIKIDTVIMFLPDLLKKILDVVTTIVSFAIVSVLWKNSLKIVTATMASGQTTAAMQIPMWIVYLGSLVGLSLALLRLAEHFIKIFMKKEEEAK